MFFPISSDSSVVGDGLTADHKLVEISACFDTDKIYSVTSAWGIYDEITSVVDPETKITNSHGTAPTNPDVTCDTLVIEKD